MTHDNGWDVSPSWQELKDERDALAGTVRAYEQSFKNLSADCDSLARRLEKTERAVRELRDERNAGYAAKTKAEEAELSAAQELDEVKTERDALAASLAETKAAARLVAPSFAAEMDRRTHDPSQCLARLKAEWQAEALEKAAFTLRDEWEEDVAANRVYQMVDELRYPAEESDP